MTSATRREPPPGPPWDSPLEEAPLAFVDLEMTGLHPDKDRVIEVCIERVRRGEVEARVASLVRPEPLAFGNTDIHGIQVADLAAAPLFETLIPSIAAALDGAVIVAHGAYKDVAFLTAEMARKDVAFSSPFQIDTLLLSQRAFMHKTHGLMALCKALGIPHDRPHRAEPDVAATRALFAKLCEVLSPRTPRDLWHVRVGMGYARPEVIEAATRAVAERTPVTVRYRPSHRNPEDLRMRLTGVRTDLDPPRVLGYLVASFAHRELRADRILAILDPEAPAPRT